MSELTLGFIGLGLIGGSIARGMKRARPGTKIMAYMRTRSKLEQARAEGIVDLILDRPDENLGLCDVIFLCTPVEYNEQYLTTLVPFIKSGTLITDVGSTKESIHKLVSSLNMDSVFIGGHPMAGSEKTGYESSSDHLLENAYYIITPTPQTSANSLDLMVQIAGTIGSIPIVIDYREHDRIVAAISHLPHIIASSLVNLVRAQDNDDEMMKRLAAGGFKDITRIASASPEMWEQICMTNSGNIADMLQAYIDSLQQIHSQLKHHDAGGIHELFAASRSYRDSLSDINRGSVTPDYSFHVDVLDEPGAISTLAVILSSNGISIRNIGINHNREHQEGVLAVSFYDEESRQKAWQQLLRFNYRLIAYK